MAVPSNLVPTRITQLPAAVTPLDGTELVPLVQVGNTRQVTASGLIALVTLSSISGVPTSRLVSTTTGQLTGGGSLAADLTLGLATTAVTSGTYGSASASVVVTFDSFGRATAASNVAITPSAIGAVPTTTQVIAGTNLAGGGPLSGNVTLNVSSTLVNQNISGGTLIGVTLSGAVYSGETLSGATLLFSTFSGGTVKNATISGSTISGGSVNNVTASGGTFNSPVVSGGTVSGVTVSGATVLFSTYSGGNVNNSTISGGNVNNATHSGGTFNTPVISGGTISGVTVSGATLLFSTFSGGTVSGSTIRTPTITGGIADAIVIGNLTPASGYFTTAYAATFSGALSGNAITATRLVTARNFSITSTIGLSSALVAFSGDAAVSLVLTGPLTISGGGTAGTDAITARSNLSVYSQQETLIFAVALG